MRREEEEEGGRGKVTEERQIEFKIMSSDKKTYVKK